MTILGQVTDNNGQVVEIATVYVSDAKGKPKGNNNATTDFNGKFRLDNVNKTDSISVNRVGLKTATVPVSKAIQLPTAPFPMLAIKMQPSEGVNLADIKVTPKDDITKGEIKNKEENKPNWLMIGLIAAGGLMALTLVVIALRKKGKK